MNFSFIAKKLTLYIKFKSIILKTFVLPQSSLSNKQVPDKLHLLGSESSLSMFKFALKMYVAPLNVV